MKNHDGSHQKVFQIMKSVRACSNFNLDDDKKARLKDAVFLKIQNIKISEEEFFLETRANLLLQNFLAKIKQEIGISIFLKASLKEKLWQKLDENYVRMPIWEFLVQRRMWAGVILGAIFLSVLIPFSDNDLFILASKKNYLVVESGEVNIIRNNEVIEAREMMVLKPGDKVTTGSQGKAEIHFANDTVARLDKETDLDITKLASQDQKENSVTAVNLNKGRLWSKVVSLPSESNKMVVASKDKLIVTADKKAAFNMTVNDDEVRLTTIENVVDFHVIPSQEKILKKPILEGVSVAVTETNVDEGQTGATELQVRILSNENASKGDAWVQENTLKDTNYTSRLQDEVTTSNIIEMGERNLTFLGRLKVKLGQASDLISETKDLIVQKRLDSIDGLLKKYGILINQIEQDINQNGSGDADAGRELLLHNLISDLETLKVLQKNLNQTDYQMPVNALIIKILDKIGVFIKTDSFITGSRGEENSEKEETASEIKVTIDADPKVNGINTAERKKTKDIFKLKDVLSESARREVSRLESLYNARDIAEIDVAAGSGNSDSSLDLIKTVLATPDNDLQ